MRSNYYIILKYFFLFGIILIKLNESHLFAKKIAMNFDNSYEYDLSKDLNNNEEDQNDQQSKSSESNDFDTVSELTFINKRFFFHLASIQVINFSNDKFGFNEKFKLNHIPFILFRPPNLFA